MEFRNVYAQGFARVAACTLPVALADPAENARRIVEQVGACHDDGVAVALFPELSLSGYAIDDLLLQDVLLDAVNAAVVTIAEATAGLTPLVLVGAPLRHGHRLYNCAVAIHPGFAGDGLVRRLEALAGIASAGNPTRGLQPRVAPPASTPMAKSPVMPTGSPPKAASLAR